MPRRIEVSSCGRDDETFSYDLTLDDRRFTTTIRYPVGVLRDAAERHGSNALDRVLAHVVAFDCFKLLTSGADFLDLGPFARFVAPSFRVLWRTMVHHVSGEWRYRSNLPSPRWPDFANATAEAASASPVDIPDVGSVLLFFGGGKDSLLSAQLLEQIGQQFSSLTYAKANYGASDYQHRLLDELLDHTAVDHRERITVDDDFFRNGVAAIEDHFEAETQWSLFLALPIAMARGYSHIVLGNERSADRGNLWWEAANEEINHQ